MMVRVRCPNNHTNMVNARLAYSGLRCPEAGCDQFIVTRTSESKRFRWLPALYIAAALIVLGLIVVCIAVLLHARSEPEHLKTWDGTFTSRIENAEQQHALPPPGQRSTHARFTVANLEIQISQTARPTRIKMAEERAVPRLAAEIELSRT